MHPALDVYAEYLHDAEASEQIRFAVARDVLDRTGFKPAEKVETESDVIVSIQFDHANQDTTIALPATDAD